MKSARTRPAGPFVRKLLRDPEVRLLYRQEKARSEVAMAVYAARKQAQLTQAALAKRAGTTQAVIARLESGKDSRMPTLPLLAAIAEACGAALELGFKFKKAARAAAPN